MNAATLLNELHSRDVALFVIGRDRLRFEASKLSLDEHVLADLHQHKPTILAILGKDGSMAKLLERRCPFCRHVGMRIEETWKSDLHYFDTRCAYCAEIVETCVPAAVLEFHL